MPSSRSASARRRRVVVVAASLLTTGAFLGTPGSVNAAPAGYEPLPAPQRLVDTRPGEPTADERLSGIGKRDAGSTLTVAVGGRVGLDASPGSVVLNLTVDQPEAPGFLTVFPCDQPRPTASNLNHVAGQTVAAAAVSRVAPDGTVCVYHHASTHLIVDVAGSFPAGTFAPLAAPERSADTRAGEPTIDRTFAGGGARSPGSVFELLIAGRGTVPSDARAVALNVTATNVAGPGFLTVFPCDSDRPTASNVNYQPGFTTPNLVVTRLDDDGRVCIYTLASVDLVVDVAGSFPAGVFEPLPEPRRLLDTRPGEPTFDGADGGAGRQQFGSTLQLDVAGRAGLPDDATAVVLNVTSTASAGPGFVTVHPQGTERPASSNLNHATGQTVANLVVAAVGVSGDVCLFNQTGTHLVVDVAGWLVGPPAANIPDACPVRPATDGAETIRSTLVRRPELHRAVGRDVVATYICDVPADSTVFDGSAQHSITDAEFAQFANDQVAPYFAAVSGGRYEVEFVPNGRITVGRNDGPGTCLDRAQSASGAGFTNAFVADSTTTAGGGFAGPGSIFTGSGAPDFDIFDRAPADAGRGGWVGGSVVSTLPDGGTIVHEVGHTLHWPHSYIGDTDEYDNPIDVMSSGQGPCSIGNLTYSCTAGNTLAFNRLAAGWLADGAVNVHSDGTANYRLERPLDDGLELLILPDQDQVLSALTLETRVAAGNDDFIEAEGVAVHVVDQFNRFGGLSGLSTGRFHRQAMGTADSYEHLVRLGDTETVHGVQITVLRRVGDAFEVRVAGSYQAPGGGFFTESASFSRSSCSVLPMAGALDAGCLH